MFLGFMTFSFTERGYQLQTFYSWVKCGKCKSVQHQVKGHSYPTNYKHSTPGSVARAVRRSGSRAGRRTTARFVARELKPSFARRRQDVRGLRSKSTDWQKRLRAFQRIMSSRAVDVSMGLPRVHHPVLTRQVGGKTKISRSDHGRPPSRNPRRYRWTCRGHLPVACCPIRKMRVSQTLEATRGGQTATTTRGTRWFVKRRCKDRESRGHQMRSPRWQRSCIVQGIPAAADGTLGKRS